MVTTGCSIVREIKDDTEYLSTTQPKRESSVSSYEEARDTTVSQIYNKVRVGGKR